MSLNQLEPNVLTEALRGEKAYQDSEILKKYPRNIKTSLKKDLVEVEKNQDSRIRKDILIERFVERLVKRYYNWWYYIRGIPRIGLPMLVTAGQRLFDVYYITGCMDAATGDNLPAYVCILCNGNNTSTPGNTMFKSFDFVLISVAIIALMILVRRGISEAHLCLKMLKFQILIRTSWYYWYRILMIGIISILCAGLSFISSVYTARVNNSSTLISCEEGAYQGRLVKLMLTDYFNDTWLWLSYYIVSVLFYWPVVNFLIDLYDTPLKIFFEPEDMFLMNGEFKGEDKLCEKLAQVDTKVRFHFLQAELSNIASEMGQIPYFRMDKIPDELLQVALLRLYNKGKVKNFKKKIEVAVQKK